MLWSARALFLSSPSLPMLTKIATGMDDSMSALVKGKYRQLTQRTSKQKDGQNEDAFVVVPKHVRSPE